MQLVCKGVMANRVHVKGNRDVEHATFPAFLIDCFRYGFHFRLVYARFVALQFVVLINLLLFQVLIICSSAIHILFIYCGLFHQDFYFKKG